MEASSRPRLLRRPADRAFDELYRRHAREVYQYALALLANPADAEDVTQTTFLNAYRAFQRGERPRKPHNWLIAIAHNVCRMRWRQAGSRPREVTLEEAPEPVAHQHERHDLDEVLTALAALSFNQRAALVMRELEGRSYQEIAEVLGLSVSAVEALLFRARRRLQVNRKSLGAITSVPLPGSLTSFLGGGGGAVTAGGSTIALKIAGIVAASAATAGLGYTSVGVLQASLRPKVSQGYVQAAVREQQRPGNAAAGAVARPRVRGAAPRRAGPGIAGASRPARPGAPQGSAQASAPPSGAAAAPGGAAAAPAQGAAAAAGKAAPTVSGIVSQTAATLPSLPSVTLPSVALPSVAVPSVPLPALPPVPVTVATPTVPPLPVTVPTPQVPPPPPLPSAQQLPPVPPLPPIPPLPTG